MGHPVHPACGLDFYFVNGANIWWPVLEFHCAVHIYVAIKNNWIECFFYCKFLLEQAATQVKGWQLFPRISTVTCPFVVKKQHQITKRTDCFILIFIICYSTLSFILLHKKIATRRMVLPEQHYRVTVHKWKCILAVNLLWYIVNLLKVKSCIAQIRLNSLAL